MPSLFLLLLIVTYRLFSFPTPLKTSNFSSYWTISPYSSYSSYLLMSGLDSFNPGKILVFG